MQKITLGIGGMSCSACSNAIEHYVKKQEGVISVVVNLVMGCATIEYDEKKLSQKQLEQFIRLSGYKSLGIYKPEDSKKELKLKRINLIVFSVFAFLLLYVAMGSMIGLPLPSFIKNNSIVFSSVTLGLTIPFLIYGSDIIFRGIKNLFKLHPNMDTLVTLGVFASFGFSLYSYIMILLGNAHFVHQLYFESAGIIIYFIKLGKYLDFASKDKTKSAIKGLVEITPKNATILREGKEVVVTLDEIVKGDIVICRAGEKIAVDGVVTKGEAHVDESFITGESKPALKSEGSKVVAGAIDFDGYIEYRAENIGRDSTVSKIVNLVVEASNTKMKISKLADKVSLIFVPTVFALAVVALVAYLIAGYSFGTAITTFTAVLVVACPCSLGLSTPVAVVVSEGVLAEHGMLIKKSESLETISKVDTIIFDKTGTLTKGNLNIESVKYFEKDIDAMRLAVSLEEKSNHPISLAFKNYAKENNIEPFDVENFEEISGMGLVGEINGEKVFVGNRRLMKKFSIEVNDEEADELFTEVFIAKNKTLLAACYVGDTIRENAEKLIKSLKEKNIKTIMLTGDKTSVAENIAKRLGIEEVVAEVLPEDKANLIKKLKSEGRIVAMMGDGINDSPALALSDVGISIHTGMDIAMNSADIVLMSDDLMKINALFIAGKKTISNIKQNLFWSFFYNVLMIPIAMGALRWASIVISPMIASIAMVLSSLTVVLNALRLKTMKLGENYMGKVTIKVEGMHCAGCVKRAEGALKKVKGLNNIETSLENKTISCTFKKQIDGNEIISALAEVGFEASVSINQ